MRIINACILLSCMVYLTIAADEHRPKKKEKRNLEYTVSHHYSTPHGYHRLERRISAGPTHPHYPPSQYYPGSSPLHSPFRKGRPHSLPVPPYAVQMEPLVHYSQRDPLYDTNSLSLNADNPKEQEHLHNSNHLASTENIERGGHAGGTIYVPHKPLIIEKPVYIKEPEPIIEIIIKESNVTLPPLPEPPTPPPQKKKKEEVQVFYVKYKKNPYGTGKNSVVYDKPIPAISPVIQDDNQEEEPIESPQDHGYGYNDDYINDVVTEPPRPSTTLRTIIKPDSEVYHSPGNNVKVTFGKEGFDYDKRSSKPEDYNGPRPESTQHPQARQLSSFSDTYFRSPIPSFFGSSSNTYKSEVRAPQPYRPFNFPPQSQHSSNNNKPPSSQFGRPPSTQFSQQPKYPFQSPPYVKPTNDQSPSFSGLPSRPNHPTYSHSISHPPPPQFHSNTRQQFGNTRPSPPKFQAPAHIDNPAYRQPVPYKPFDNYKPATNQYQQQRPSFTQHQSRPQPQHPPSFAPQPVSAPQPTRQTAAHHSSSTHSFSNTPKHIQFRPETHFTAQQNLPLQDQKYSFRDPTFSDLNNEYKGIIEPHLNGPSAQPLQRSKPQPQQINQFKENQQLPHLNGNGQFTHQYPPQSQQQQESYKQKQQQQQQQQQQEQQQQQQQHQIFELQRQQQKLQQLQEQNAQQNSFIQHQNSQQNEHLSNLQTAQNLLPAGGELIQSVPKYEQHVVYDAATGQPSQSLALQGEQPKFLSQEDYFRQLQQHTENNNQVAQGPSQEELNQQISAQQHRNLKQIYTIQQTSQRPFVYSTSEKPIFSSTQRSYQSTTEEPTTTTKEPEKPSTTTKDPKILEAQLPDEVPDDLREQLLSSGILNHADISILDYDKVGDIPLSALPSDQLANFYNAGGGQQIAGAASEQVSQFADPYQRKSDEQSAKHEEVQETAASEIEEVRVQPDTVQLKPEVQEAQVKDNSKPADPVLNDNSYNRYLPLKINGTQFPVPEHPELKGRKITSVVVLAPVTYDFSQQKTKEARSDPDDIDLIQSAYLKKLLAEPTLENYKKFLDNENKTSAAQQSIILLVTGSDDGDSTQKEIFMYDVATRTVSKLNGELSSAFVDAAEANSSTDSEEAASNVIETRVPFTRNIEEKISRSEAEAGIDLEAAASDFVESKATIIEQNNEDDLETEASEQLNSVVDILKIQRSSDDLTKLESDENKISTTT